LFIVKINKKGIIMKKMKLMLASIAAMFTLAMPVAVVAPVLAQSDIQDGLCQGSQLGNPNASGNCNVQEGQAGKKIEDLVLLIINILSWVIGVVAVIMIIVGGFKYITSGGDSGGVTSAKNTILYAIVGLVIVALAQVIVRFVLGSITNATN
jgi:Type IV secretion system pilin